MQQNQHHHLDNKILMLALVSTLYDTVGTCIIMGEKRKKNFQLILVPTPELRRIPKHLLQAQSEEVPSLPDKVYLRSQDPYYEEALRICLHLLGRKN